MLMISGIIVLALMTGVLATGFAQEERRREYLRVWDQVARGPIFASLGVVTLSEIVGKLNTEINAALADPQMQARFADLAATPLPGSPTAFRTFVADETEKWGRVVKFANIKPE